MAAYALLSLGRLDGNGAVFQLLNLAGSAAVCVNSSVNGAWPSATLNVVWMAIGAVALARLRKKVPASARAISPGYGTTEASDSS